MFRVTRDYHNALCSWSGVIHEGQIISLLGSSSVGEIVIRNNTAELRSRSSLGSDTNVIDFLLWKKSHNLHSLCLSYTLSPLSRSQSFHLLALGMHILKNENISLCSHKTSTRIMRLFFSVNRLFYIMV